MIQPLFKVFISVPFDTRLSPQQIAIKYRLIELVKHANLEPQLQGEMGTIVKEAWRFDTIDRITRQCQGMIVLGLARWEFHNSEGIFDSSPRPAIMIVRWPTHTTCRCS